MNDDELQYAEQEQKIIPEDQLRSDHLYPSEIGTKDLQPRFSEAGFDPDLLKAGPPNPK